jgi:hypothetical protein
MDSCQVRRSSSWRTRPRSQGRAGGRLRLGTAQGQDLVSAIGQALSAAGPQGDNQGYRQNGHGG